MEKNIEKLISIDFNNKPTYGDDHKYIKTKKTDEDSITTNFYNKKGLKNTNSKSTIQMLINNNSRFCSLCI